MKLLEGKVAVVTGAARGIGKAIALKFAQEGANIAFTDLVIDENGLATQAEIEALGVKAKGYASNAANFEETHNVVAEIVKDFGRIDILVNNAGATWGAKAEEHPLAAWDKVMDLNIRGYFLLSQAVARAGMLQRGGRIINISSIAGLGGNPIAMRTLAYNTSKGAVLNFTRALAAEWGPQGITVNAVCPGFFRTKMASGLIDSIGEAQMCAQAPLRRLGDDEDLKGITVLLASAAGKHITGQWLAVDGGVSAVLG